LPNIYEVAPEVEMWVANARAAFAHITDHSWLEWGGDLLFEKMHHEAEEEKRVQDEETQWEEEQCTRQIAEEAKRLEEDTCRRTEEEREKVIATMREDAEAKIDEFIEMAEDGCMTQEASKAAVKKVNEELETEIKELKSGVQEEEMPDHEMEVDAPESDDASPPLQLLKLPGKHKRVESENEEEEEVEEVNQVGEVEGVDEVVEVEGPGPLNVEAPSQPLRKRAPRKRKDIVRRTEERLGDARVRRNICAIFFMY
jgi:hypothetical protein